MAQAPSTLFDVVDQDRADAFAVKFLIDSDRLEVEVAIGDSVEDSQEGAQSVVTTLIRK